MQNKSNTSEKKTTLNLILKYQISRGFYLHGHHSLSAKKTFPANYLHTKVINK